VLAIQTVRENPYTLAKEIHGIGFATADQIAQSVGIPKDSQNRAGAGIDHVLLGATSEGHCALPLEKLKLAAMKLLEVPVETVEQAVSKMLTSGSLAGGDRRRAAGLPASPEKSRGRHCDENQAAGRCRAGLSEDRF
jgi:ATP-dependent exoDNAse (exonuclease V) alpha subunit